MKTIIKLILIYLGFQLLAGCIVAPIMFLAKGPHVETYMLGITLCLGSIFLAWYLFAKKYIHIDKRTWSICSIGILILTILLGFGFYFFAGGINEMIGLPNLMEDQFLDLSTNIAGILGIVIIGPIAEELLFRGAILGLLLKNKKLNPSYAILISALIFGIIHFNPAQILYAFLLGLFLGRLYYQSGSLLLCMLVHVILNGFSTLLMICYPEADTLEEMGIPVQLTLLIVIGAAFTIVCSYFLNRLLKELPRLTPDEGNDDEQDNAIDKESKG